MTDDYFMQKAIELAARGWPKVAPNPIVGCVIVKNGAILSQGFHQQFGAAHAEVNAINNLPANCTTAECDLYVTLEPCSHFGKTPPCADLLVEKKFKRVVIACQDPNPLVAGKGIEKLQLAGIEVTQGVLQDQARELNRRFFTFFEQKRPYIILKWALSADGFIARDPHPAKREDNIITGYEAQKMVHELRAGSQAIMVGKNTVIKDDPELNTRLVPGNNPTRVIVDKNLQLPLTARIFNDKAPTFVFNLLKDGYEKNVKFIKINGNDPVTEVLNFLYKQGLQSILIEGGTQLLNDFIKKELWDEVYIFQNPALYFKNGISGPQFSIDRQFQKAGNDILYHRQRPI